MSYVMKVCATRLKCTCVAHVIAVRCSPVHGHTTCIIYSFWVLAGFRFGHWCSVSTQVPRLHGWSGLLMSTRQGDQLLEAYVDFTDDITKSKCKSFFCLFCWTISDLEIKAPWMKNRNVTWVKTHLPDMDHHRTLAHLHPWKRGKDPRCVPSHGSLCFGGLQYQSRLDLEPYLLQTHNICSMAVCFTMRFSSDFKMKPYHLQVHPS